MNTAPASPTIDDAEEKALRAQWNVTCGGDEFAALLCVAVLRASDDEVRGDCRADLHDYLGDSLPEWPAAVRDLT